MMLGLKGSGTLGDALWLTPAMRVRKDITVQMHNDEQSRQVSTIYNGLAKVEFVDNPAEKLYHKTNEPVHYAQRVLNQLGITEVNCIPHIKLEQKEIDFAHQYLVNIGDIKNPLAIVNDNSGCHDPFNYRAQYVRPNPKLIQQSVYSWKKAGFTIIQFGRNDDRFFTPLEGVIQIRGASIRQLAAFYHIIGKGIFGDTGDYHLMLSVGGTSLTLVPDESKELGYIYDELHYKPELWKGQKIRCRYINFNTGEPVYNYE